MSLRPSEKLSPFRGNVITVQPATEPVTAADLRSFLVETTASLPDTEANALISEARQLIEDGVGIAMITQTWKVAFDRWPVTSGDWWSGVRQGSISDLHGAADSVTIPRFPLQSIVSVTTYDESGAGSVAGAIFDVDTYQKPGRISLRSGQTLPSATRSVNAIEIVYVAGYGAAVDVPAVLKRAVKQVAAYLYSHKGDDCDYGDALKAAGNLVDNYRVAKI